MTIVVIVIVIIITGKASGEKNEDLGTAYRTHYHDINKMGILTSLLLMRNKRHFKLPSKPVVFFFSSQITFTGHLII